MAQASTIRLAAAGMAPGDAPRTVSPIEREALPAALPAPDAALPQDAGPLPPQAPAATVIEPSGPATEAMDTSAAPVLMEPADRAPRSLIMTPRLSAPAVITAPDASGASEAPGEAPGAPADAASPDARNARPDQQTGAAQPRPPIHRTGSPRLPAAAEPAAPAPPPESDGVVYTTFGILPEEEGGTAVDAGGSEGAGSPTVPPGLNIEGLGSEACDSPQPIVDCE